MTTSLPRPRGDRRRAPAPVRCHACDRPVELTPDGAVQVVGIAPREAPRVWVWGPVLVHDACRYEVTTPYDELTGYLPVDQRVVCR